MQISIMQNEKKTLKSTFDFFKNNKLITNKLTP